MASIELKNITKTFDKHDVIKDLNLNIEDGSFTVLVGPSGCGKTTLLRMIAGLDPQTSGQVLVGGRDVSKTPPGQRGIAMVFQNYAIYPTMSVRENIEFGLKNNKVPKEERKELIESITETVGLKDYLDRKPSTLSGGQRQRVALARAMVKKPSVFLMDEPLSNLDAKLRVQMRIELIELHKKLGTTFVYVTHDQVEAMSMADKIVLMNRGVIQQEASPDEMYHIPANQFTAQFIGVPPMNITHMQHKHLTFGFRPESATIGREPQPGLLQTMGEILTREMLGSETIYQVKTPIDTFMIKSLDDQYKVNEQIYLSLPEEKIHFFDDQEKRIHQSTPLYLDKIQTLRGQYYG
ncbi:ABC transporter ATP-binding protein [Paenibacillus septentrionalis]|uniref:ABC transporter ATP-binding protein n=1 Tax=Paenibacillus septentrionalis TaxID=429342 RepID=A0ABW1V3J1_9BACL